MFGWAQPPARPPRALLPPAPVPGLGEQMEELISFRLGLGRRYRIAFEVLDRMRVIFGEDTEPPRPV